MTSHTPGCRPDPKHPGYWICTEKGHTQGPLVFDEKVAFEAADEYFDVLTEGAYIHWPESRFDSAVADFIAGWKAALEAATAR